MSSINYSKWDHIEISDDEDDTHPNIDTPSLFRWRHQARVEKMDKLKKDKESFQSTLESHKELLADTKRQLKEATEADSSDATRLKTNVQLLEKEQEKLVARGEELKKEERLTPLNVDTLTKEGKSKTMINKAPPPPKELTDEERIEKQQTFTKKYKNDIKKYGMLQKWDASKEFLQANNHLVCEETANYLVIWCIDLEVEEKHDLMNHVSHQCIVMQFILELAKNLKTDPRSCVGAFFSRIKLGEKQYMDAFNDELSSFRERIKGRAKVRIEDAMREYEEEERAKRLGPGGLDPAEVMETLPEKLKACFDSQDVGLLQATVADMDQAEAAYHIKRCVDSGLWVPGAEEEDASGTKKEDEATEASENVYEQVD